MKKNLIEIAIQNKKTTIMIAIFLMILGLYSYAISPRQETPDSKIPLAVITTIYPGASPEEIEKMVTSKVEEKTKELKGFDSVYSFSMDSVSLVYVALDYDTKDYKDVWEDLRRKIDDLRSELPGGINDIEINTETMETAGMILSLSGDNYSYDQLEHYGIKIKKALSSIDGLKRFEIIGKLEKEVKVIVDIEKINKFDLSLEDIRLRLQAQNIEIPSGSIGNKEAEINVRTLGTFNSLKDIENTIIDVSQKTGAAVKIKDIANVEWGLNDSTYKFKHNGKNTILLVGYFEPNKNIVMIDKKLKTKLEEVLKVLPKDLKVDKIIYEPQNVEKATKDFAINLLQGILFVIIVVFIGMGKRNSIIVSMALPFSILVTFLVMNIIGIKIHQMSIAALIIALGMLVDNAIVVSDAIQVRLDNGEDKLNACINGTKEVALPVFSSTLTTIAVFGPWLFIPGIAGDFVSSIPRIVIIALTASYFCALFITPTMAYLFFKPNIKTKETSKIRSFFQKSLEFSMKRKYMTIIITSIVFLIALKIPSIIGMQFFPKADKDIIYIDINTELEGNLDKTEEITNNVYKILEKQPEVVQFTSAIGDGIPRFHYAMNFPIKTRSFAQILVKLDLEKEKRFRNNKEFVDNIQEIINSKIVGATVSVHELEQGKGIETPINVRLSGTNLIDLLKAKEEIKRLLNSIEGTVNVKDNAIDKQYEFVINPDRDIASNMGITQYDIQNQVNLALRGRSTSIFRKEGEEYNILVTSNIASKADLENLAVKSSFSTNKILLKQIANIELQPRWPSIIKHNGEMAVEVSCGLKKGYSSYDIEQKIRERIKEKQWRDISFTFDGEQWLITESFGQAGMMGLFALGIIYMILMTQFNSFIQPFIIMLSIPLSMIGALMGLLIFGKQLSFTAFLGIISLFGIVVNNAIVLVDFINAERKRNKDVETACKDAMARRFKPIMLSTITTVIGLIPLAMSKIELFVPMSIALMMGLLVSMILTLIIIPVIYALVFNMSFFKSKAISKDIT